MRFALGALMFALLLTPPHARAGAFYPPWPLIVPVTPGETHAVPAGSPLAYVAARIIAQAPLVRVQLLIDGAPAPTHVQGRDDRHQSVIYQPRHLLPGVHIAYVIAWDRAGYFGWRAWNFSIAP